MNGITELPQVSDGDIRTWLEFWGDVKHISKSGPKQVQSDILFYLKVMRRYKQLTEELLEVVKETHEVLDGFYDGIRIRPELKCIAGQIKMLHGMTQNYLPKAIESNESPNEVEAD